MAVIMVLINSVGRVSIVNHVHNPTTHPQKATAGRNRGTQPQQAKGTRQEGDQGGTLF